MVIEKRQEQVGGETMVGTPINGRSRQVFSLVNGVGGGHDLTPGSAPPSNAGLDYGIIEFTREDVEALLNEKAKRKDRFNYKIKRVIKVGEATEHPSGVYFGWAGLSSRGVFKMVMNIGWNPYFDNKEKTIEPWILHKFDEDFYGEELRLIIVGYIRPEANFPSLESLIAKIHEDGEIAEKALELPLCWDADHAFIELTL
ncbi:hypothetical protein AAHE18_19G163400 [Arachis hypogaea]